MIPVWYLLAAAFALPTEKTLANTTDVHPATKNVELVKKTSNVVVPTFVELSHVEHVVTMQPPMKSASTAGSDPTESPTPPKAFIVFKTQAPTFTSFVKVPKTTATEPARTQTPNTIPKPENAPVITNPVTVSVPEPAHDESKPKVVANPSPVIVQNPVTRTEPVAATYPETPVVPVVSSKPENRPTYEEQEEQGYVDHPVVHADSKTEEKQDSFVPDLDAVPSEVSNSNPFIPDSIEQPSTSFPEKSETSSDAFIPDSIPNLDQTQETSGANGPAPALALAYDGSNQFEVVISSPDAESHFVSIASSGDSASMSVLIGFFMLTFSL